MGIIGRYKEISLFRKHFDLITNIIHYPIANLLCAIISKSFITPNMVTFLAFLSELGAAWLIFINLQENKIIIVLLLQFGWIFDLMDGLLARYKRIGFYHPTNPSLKGYYWDSVSDHIMRLLVLSSLGIHLAQQEQYGFYYAIGGILIHAITQMEHIIRDYVQKDIKKHQKAKGNKNKAVEMLVLLFSNIHLFFFIFILLNRIDLLFIILPTIQILLVTKRVLQFSFSNY